MAFPNVEGITEKVKNILEKSNFNACLGAIKIINDVISLYVKPSLKENNPKAIPEFQTRYEFKNDVKYISETLVFSTSSIT